MLLIIWVVSLVLAISKVTNLIRYRSEGDLRMRDVEHRKAKRWMSFFLFFIILWVKVLTIFSILGILSAFLSTYMFSKLIFTFIHRKERRIERSKGNLREAEELSSGIFRDTLVVIIYYVVKAVLYIGLMFMGYTMLGKLQDGYIEQGQESVIEDVIDHEEEGDGGDKEELEEAELEKEELDRKQQELEEQEELEKAYKEELERERDEAELREREERDRREKEERDRREQEDRRLKEEERLKREQEEREEELRLEIERKEKALEEIKRKQEDGTNKDKDKESNQGYTYYTVTSEDSLGGIALESGMTEMELMELNGLEESELYEGQELKVNVSQ